MEKSKPKVEIVIIPTHGSLDPEVIQAETQAKPVARTTSKIVIQPFRPSEASATNNPSNKTKLFMGTRQMDFYKIISSETSCLNYFTKVGILSGDRINGYCRAIVNGHPCETALQEYPDANIYNYTHIKYLKCYNEACGSVRRANKLLSYTDSHNHNHNSNRLSLSQIMELIWMWCHQYIKPMAEQLSGQPSSTVREWYRVCQEICDFKYQQRKRMGGPNENVHVDEYLCSEKFEAVDNSGEPYPETLDEERNYGNRLFGPWIFAICWTRGSKILDIRHFVVERRDAETLLTIIRNEVLPSSTIHCDTWAAYETLPEYGYDISCHARTTQIFHDPETGRRTRTVERLCDYIKRKHYDIKTDNTRKSLQFLAREEWWRNSYPSTIFNVFLNHMKEAYCD